jgi:serine/threonine protein phosphatase 1
MENRTLVIGDIHGSLKALEQVIERASVSKNDKLIFLGDYVDGWSQSFEVIQYLLELNKTNECVFVRGNHDTWCEEWLNTNIANEIWLKHGGEATVKSYLSASHEDKINHLAFYNSMVNYFIDSENNLFIHAGYSSMHGPQAEVYATNYSWDRTLWEMALVMDKRVEKESRLYPKRLKLFNEIYIGHTPTLNYDVDIPMNAINIWNVDTGAAFYGKLSILDINTKEYWQSDVVKDLHPNEKGRN